MYPLASVTLVAKQMGKHRKQMTVSRKLWTAVFLGRGKRRKSSLGLGIREQK